MTRIGVVRHKVSDFSDWKRKFDERMAVRKSKAGLDTSYFTMRTNKKLMSFIQ